MKLANFLISMSFLLLLGAPLYGQVEEETLVVYQGSSKNFQLKGDVAPPIIKSIPTEGNTLELTSTSGADYTYTYTPDPSFLGNDVFSIDEVVSVFPVPSTITHIFNVQVIASVVDANDDFVSFGTETIVVNAKDNDMISSGVGEVSVVQVLYGSALVDSDGNIEYTPSGEPNDFIIYSVKDNFGSSSNATIYLREESADPISNTNEGISLLEGNSTYLFMPGNGYSMMEDTNMIGSVTEVVDGLVYSYTATSEGNDVVVFENGNGLKHTVNMTVLEGDVDDGFVKNDTYYTALNTQIQFDVKSNDITSQYVISDYSDELYHIGNGIFSYTPQSYFTGTKTFFYEADNGTNLEQGEITIIINNYKPMSTQQYEMATVKNQPRVIEYEVPLGTEYFTISSYPYHGTLEVFNDNQSIDVACETDLKKVFILYTPHNNFVGSDNVIVRYCASDNNDCNDVSIAFDVIDTDVNACICVDDCVWPGDANGDGRVNVRDALSIARHMGASGEDREESPYGEDFAGTKVSIWGDVQPNGKSVGYADTDGNGLVSMDDAEVIEDNYGALNNIVSTDLLGVKQVPFYITTDNISVDSGSVMNLYINVGTSSWPAVDMRGVAFAVNLPSSMVDSASVSMDWNTDNYFVKNAPFLEMVHQPVDGQIHAAVGKTNGTGSTGFGTVATLSFIVEEDAEGIRKNKKRNTEINSSEIVTIELSDIIFEDVSGNQFALPSYTLDIEVNSGSEGRINRVDVFPNPISMSMSIESIEKIETITVFDISGRKVEQLKDVNSTSLSMNTSNYRSGVYFVEIQTTSDTEMKKIIKQ